MSTAAFGDGSSTREVAPGERRTDERLMTLQVSRRAGRRVHDLQTNPSTAIASSREDPRGVNGALHPGKGGGGSRRFHRDRLALPAEASVSESLAGGQASRV